MVHSDGCVKHNRLLTLIRLFEDRNTGNRVGVLVHDNDIFIIYLQHT